MNFIHQETISDLTVCDKLIDFFKNNDSNWVLGKTGVLSTTGVCGEESIVNSKIKKSTDMQIPISDIENNSLITSYVEELHKVAKNYIEKFNFCNKTENWGIVEDFNIQYYKPNEAFYEWHCERATYKYPMCNRHLVWMTYLNDVENDGETEFYYQKLKIKPQKGLTLIWPADWTHTHRGVASKIDEKYIITGWFNFIKND